MLSPGTSDCDRPWASGGALPAAVALGVGLTGGLIAMTVKAL